MSDAEQLKDLSEFFKVEDGQRMSDLLREDDATKTPVKSARKPSSKELLNAPKKPTRKRRVIVESEGEEDEQQQPEDEEDEEGEEELQAEVLMKRQRAKRVKSLKAGLEKSGVDLASIPKVPFDSHWYMFALERCLRWWPCDDCVKFYLGDKDKVIHLGGGYRMNSWRSCRRCTDGNNAAKKEYKKHFGKQPA